MRVTFVIETLGVGGAERVMVDMANYWSRNGHSIEILTFWPEGSIPFYRLDDAVVHSPLSITRDSHNIIEFVGYNLSRVKAIRHAIIRSAADVVISFMDRANMLAVLGSIGLRIPVVVCERTDPSEHSIGGRGWQLLRRLTYSRAHCVVVQTRRALSYFGRAIRQRASVIPNSISFPPEAIRPFSRRGCGHKIVSIGRLVNPKGFDLLLRAFSGIHSEFPEWSLTIWGEGPERAALEKLRETLGLVGCAHFPGKTQSAFKEIREADLFVFSSRYEGFPNVLLEAMACNLPVISFDCPSGPSEIIRDGVDGLLVPPADVSALGNAMRRLIDNAPLRSELAQRAGEVVQRFSRKAVMGQWEELIRRVIQSSGKCVSGFKAEDNFKSRVEEPE